MFLHSDRFFTVSPPPPRPPHTFCCDGGGGIFSLKGRDQKKVEGWEKKWVPGGALKSPSHRYLPGGGYYVSCQKRIGKMKYGFEG